MNKKFQNLIDLSSDLEANGQAIYEALSELTEAEYEEFTSIVESIEGCPLILLD